MFSATRTFDTRIERIPSSIDAFLSILGRVTEKEVEHSTSENATIYKKRSHSCGTYSSVLRFLRICRVRTVWFCKLARRFVPLYVAQWRNGDAQMANSLHVRSCQELVEHGASCQACRDCVAEDFEAEDLAHSGRDPIEVAYTEAKLAADLLSRVHVNSALSPTSRPSQRRPLASQARLRACGERGIAAVSMMLHMQPCGSHQPVLSADSAPPSPGRLKSLEMMPFSRLRSLMPSMPPAVCAAHVPKEPKAPSSKASLVNRMNGWKRDAARRLRSLHTGSHVEARDSSQEFDAEGYEQIWENFIRAASTCPGETAGKWHQMGSCEISSDSGCSTASGCAIGTARKATKTGLSCDVDCK